MAKQGKVGRPAISTRDDVAVKIDRTLVAKARYVAENKRVSLAEYLSGAAQPTVLRDFNLVAKEKP